MRRRWRALSLMAPSLNLPPTVQDGFDTIYPFSVKPDKKLTLNDFFAVYRDHYEGTSFDLTTNVIDPFGNPNRYNTTGMDAGGDVGT
jgi:dipeptidase